MSDKRSVNIFFGMVYVLISLIAFYFKLYACHPVSLGLVVVFLFCVHAVVLFCVRIKIEIFPEDKENKKG